MPLSSASRTDNRRHDAHVLESSDRQVREGVMRRNIAISERSQIVILWSFVVFAVIYILGVVTGNAALPQPFKRW